MNIILSVPYHRQKSARRFCRFIIKNLQNNIKRFSEDPQVEMRLSLLEASDWINSSRKLNAKSVCNDIANALEYARQRDDFIIRFNPRKRLTGTSVSIYSIVRYINYGNEYVKGCYIFSNMFSRYQSKIYNYWRAFLIRNQLKVRSD